MRAICFSLRVGVEAHIEALVAAFDLDVVRLLRDAIRTTETAGARNPKLLEPAAVYEPRRHIHPEPVIEPRRHIHPTPDIEPTHALKSAPAQTMPAHCACPSPVEASSAVPTPVSVANPQPPWRTLPWPTPRLPAPLKVTVIRPDIISGKGAMLDLFI